MMANTWAFHESDSAVACLKDDFSKFVIEVFI